MGCRKGRLQPSLAVLRLRAGRLQSDLAPHPRTALEYLGKLGEKYGRDANYDDSIRKVVIPQEGRQSILPLFAGDPLIVDAVDLGTRLIEPDLNNFGPRFGLAWQPFDTAATVIRAAYGIYYTQPSGFLNFQTAQGPPYNSAFAFSRPVAIGAGGRPPSF